MSNPLDSLALALFVDHTLLKPEATAADVRALVAEGVRLGVYAVCVSPSFLPIDAQGLKVATVVGFPSGKHRSAIKAAEAARAVADGADEVDMVIDIGAAKARDFESIREDIAMVRAAAPAPTVLKVIIESAALSDHEIVETSRAAEAAGADFVKTSTGFHPAGGATVHAVEIISATGGGRTTADALAMVQAGATRLGLSGTAAVLDGFAAGDHPGIG